MDEPNGSNKESHSTEKSQIDESTVFISETKGDNETPEEHGKSHRGDPQDEIEETLRRFREFVKDTFRRASPGERLTAWTNLMLIAIAFVGAVIYIQQLSAMRGQLDGTIVDQRSWVGPKQFFIVNPPIEANKPIEIGMDYSNFGKTPAINVSGFAQPFFVRPRRSLIFLIGSSRYCRIAASFSPGPAIT
jgi:hypothetical protein